VSELCFVGTGECAAETIDPHPYFPTRRLRLEIRVDQHPPESCAGCDARGWVGVSDFGWSETMNNLDVPDDATKSKDGM
jgi:hypothetical protein